MTGRGRLMAEDAFLEQARRDAQELEQLSRSMRDRMDRETDWSDYHRSGYTFPEQHPAR